MTFPGKISLYAALIASTALAQEAPIDCFKTDLALTGTAANGAVKVSDLSLISGETSEITLDHSLVSVDVCYRTSGTNSRIESVQTKSAIWNEDGTETTNEVVSPMIGKADEALTCVSLNLAKDESVTSFNASFTTTYLSQMTFSTTLQNDVSLGLGATNDRTGGTETFSEQGNQFSGLMGDVAEDSYLTTVSPIGYDSACLTEQVTALDKDFGWTTTQIEAKRAENAANAANDAANAETDNGENENTDGGEENTDEGNIVVDDVVDDLDDEISNVINTPDDMSSKYADYDDVVDERDLFQILTIVFAVLFIIAMSIAIFLMIKMKKARQGNFVTNLTVTEGSHKLVTDSNVTTSQIDMSANITKKTKK